MSETARVDGAANDRDLERVASRILLKLARPGRFLRRRKGLGEAGSAEAGAAYELIGATCLDGASAPLFSAAIIGSLLRHDWLEADGQALRLSHAGRAWLKRRLSRSDPFREQHQLRETRTVTTESGVRRPALFDDHESPLAWLRRRKDKTGQPLITAYQYQAGERLRADFFRAQMTPRVSASWDALASTRKNRRGPAGDAAALRDHVVAARQRVQAALAAAGPDLADVLIDVCCHLKGLEDAEKAKGWPRRSGKVVLQIALTRLAQHYGLISRDDMTRPVKRRLQHWGAAGYRPSIPSG